ncbi:acid phosphatase [Derxia lacustris]|uniref:acid phosphatase n=1 Tax=Derxia lacustris TaxID=764842 RepID=UPI000A16CC01|nr:acid phosphatase [Derxia lacustris]
MTTPFFPRRTLISLAALLALGACNSDNTTTSVDDGLKAKVQNIVVIYAENRSFDNLFGNFPGANGLSAVIDANGKPTAAYVPQKDRNGTTVLATLPQTWGGVTAPGISPVVTAAQSAGLANQPFQVETAFKATANATLTTSTVTRDLYHRFFENQMEIDGGKNDMFAAWADAGGLTMGHFDYSGSALYKLAQQYVLADNFFEGAFGGSFLNHQYLICACAPEYPNADTAAAKPTIAVLDTDSSGKYLPRLTTAATSPASALDGPPVYVKSGNITPANYFGDGKFYAVNTMQAPYQPSGVAPASIDGNNNLYANTAAATTLPPQTQKTIGDLLTAKNVSWAWYGGAWNAALNDGTQDPATKRTVIYAGNSNGIATTSNVDFQPHHQPFNYYAAFDPVKHAGERASHLKDYNDLVAAAAAGSLPAVAFYKPEGVYNQHEGYANLTDGDAKIADLIAKLQASPQWKNMVVVITYDEFGGVWDHVAPPKGDLLGPGTRIPAIIVSPLAKKGTVDHTQYDTASILRLITRRFGLDTLAGLASRDNALKAAGGTPMGDLTNALNLQ